jgi:pyruvate dehydrogenase E1 component beta subunit
VRDTPIAEQAIVGTAIGAALSGLRPVAEIMFADFAAVCFDGIANELAKYRYMTGGQVDVPATIRLGNGAGAGFAAQHSQSVENWFLNVAGLKIAVPATPADAYGLLRAAIQDPDPVLVFEHGSLYPMKGELADAGHVDIDHAAVRRSGDDLTLITYGGTLGKTLEAAERLAEDGISAEVIDLRTLRPLDDECIMTSVRRTHRAVIVDEGWRSGSLSAEISARVMEQALYDLDAPVQRVCTAEVPIPYAKHLEDAALPQVEAIVAASRQAMG